MKPEIDQLASLSPAQRALLETRLRRRRTDAPSTAIPRRQDASLLPLSFAQQRLWFIEQLDPGSAAYNIAGAVRLAGTLDVVALRRGFDEILKRHDVLRACVTAVDGQPVQTIAPHRPFELPVVDLQGSDEADRIAEARQHAAEEAARPFDLAESPLLRARLLRFDEHDHVLVLAMHHIASDGWSTGIVLREVSAVYAALVGKSRAQLSALPVQYADYAAWQRQALDGDALARQVSWWREALADLPAMELPADRVRPAVQSTRGARQRHALPAALSRAINELGRSQGATPFSVLLAAFDVLLSRYCGTRDVVVGSPVAGRSRTEIEGLVGLFVNTLVLRAEVNPDATFSELVHRVQQGVLDALARQDVPFEMLVDELQPQRTLSHSPLAPILFAFQNVPLAPVQLPGLSLAAFEFERTTARFDLCLFAVDTGLELVLSAEYSTDLFDAPTIGYLLTAFEGLLSSIVANPNRRVADLPWVGSHDRDELIHRWNQTAVEYPRERTVAELFEAQAKARPEALALVAGDRRLTYGQLNIEANRLARHMEALGVTTGALVGICLERSIEMIVATLAIVKAGAAYVPLDPAYPDSRLKQMLDDCGARVVITTEALRGRLPGSTTVVCVDREADAIARHLGANLLPRSTAGSRAYVMYTSGSTGVPKGVEIIHRGITRLLFGVDYVHLGSGETILQLAPFSFDAATFEIWGALLHGGRLVLYPDRIPTARELGDTIRAHSVTTMWLTGSLYNAIVDESPGALTGLRQLLIGGDALSVPHVRRGLQSLPGVQFINGYGPTESTTFTCCEPIAHDLPADARSVPIGRPIGNTWVYLLDPAMNPVPVGAPGELYIGGDGLALGYLGAPALTAERFVADPFRAGKRLYRSGDLARYLSDGRLEFLGRLDQQVKIRGYRIECGEIEAALVASAGIREAAVVPVPDDGGRKRLVAYIVPETAAEPTVHDLRRRLLDVLPEYMVPSAFVYMSSLPLTRNGKVDMAALPDPATARVEDVRDRLAPRTDREAILSRIWATVLRVDEVGVHDNFFELGGDSILSIQIVARANDQGLALRPKDVFRYQTIAELAEAVEERPVVSAEQGEVVGRTAPTPIERWFFELGSPRPQHFNQAIVLDLGSDVSIPALEGAVRAIVSHHDALRLRFLEQTDGTWQGDIAPSSQVAPFDTIDLRAAALDAQAAAIERAGTEMNARLTFDGGLARFAVVLIRGGARLLAIVHHLAVDGVSWRVLIEDLQTAYGQLRRGERVGLPAKTTSWPAWTKRLSTLKDYAVTSSEEVFWLDVARDARSIPVDAVRPSANTIDGADRLSASLPADETRVLLQDVPGAFHTQATDVLLAGLALSFRGWAEPGTVMVDLERHGREPLFDDDDVTRTVGWFTTLFPVRVEVPEQSDPVGALKTTKERLRAIPRNGIGYGLLRYLSSDPAVRARLAAQPGADIGFNYLGQFDQVASAPGSWRFASESPGQVWDGKTPRTHLIDITAVVVDGSLRFTWTYCRAAFRRDTIERLAASLVDALRTLITTCTTPGVGGWTPSDFALARIDQPAVDLLQATYRGMADVYPLSPLQHGLLFHAVDGSATTAYVEQVSCTIDASFDPVAFQAAWAEIIGRHAVLRTVFDWETLDRPVQIVLDRITPEWSIEDWREVPAEERKTDLDAWLAADVARGFQLNRPPLLRFALIRVSDSAWRFVWSFHHILLDGWCLPILLKEVAGAYAAIAAGRQADQVRHQPYRDYIAWLQGQDAAAAETFWRSELDAFTAATPMPVQTASGSGECRVYLSEAASSALQALARREQLTASTIVQAAWALVLARCSGDQDIVFGTTVSGRPADLGGVESMIGLFINTLPLRIDVDWSAPFLPWLRTLQTRHLAVREHEHVGLSDVRRWSGVPAGSPLFESLVVFENYPVDLKAAAPGAAQLRLRDFLFRERTNFPLTLVASPSTRLSLKLIFDGVASDAANRLLSSVENVLVQFASGQVRCLGDVVLTSANETDAVLALGAGEWTSLLPPASTIGALFDHQAEARGAHEAVRCGEESLTYAALQARSNQWAHLLRRHGVGPEVIVGVCLDGSIDLIAVLLGVVKAGGAYMALDPSYPAARLQLMVRETHAPVIVTDRLLRDRLPIVDGVAVIEIDSSASALASEPDTTPGLAITPEHLAYISYTSGSTGQPKGVAVPHRGVVRLLFGVDYARFSPEQTWLQLAPVGFDASTLEIWGALLHGGRLVVASDRMPTPQSLGALLQAERVTAMWLTSSLYNAVIDALPEALSGLEQLLIGGEALSVPHVRRGLALLGSTQIINGYGPTESTTFACCHPIVDPTSGTSIPIGRPIGRTRVFVLDPTGAPVPVGLPGELCIGGEGLARAYMGQAARTAERFVPDPISGVPGARLYRTGDIVRWTADGVIEFVGRRDAQVKVRGFRVEPGEIEAVLASHPSLRGVAVVTREDRGVKRLVAYVVPDGSLADEDSLRSFLKDRLPDYMIPAAFVSLNELPRTANGKLDRAALPEPALARSEARRDPLTAAETVLSEIWSDVLGVDSIGADENFFELGGDSILSIQICARAQRAGWSVTPKQLFEHQTVAGLAGVAVRREERGGHDETVSGATGVLPIQRWFFEQELADPHHFTQSSLLRVHGVPAVIVEDAVHALIAHHDALRSRFTRSSGGWTARIEPPEAGSAGVWSRVVASGGEPEAPHAAIERAAAALQSSLDFEQGPLVRATFFDATPQSRLLIVIHHLVVDTVSWRILLEDLELACSQRMSGLPISLPEKTSSVPRWAEQLTDYANAPALGAARAWWRGVRPGERLPVDYGVSAAANTIGSAASVSVELSSSETRSLLQETPKAYQTQINDVLLTALAQAAAPWTRSSSVLVDLEGHGREAEFEHVDLGRTVGWFTTIMPVRLTIPGGADVGTSLRSVKEQLRAIPGGGLACTALRYLSSDAGVRSALASAATAEIGFNYLGQYDRRSSDSLFSPAPESAGLTASPRQRRRHLIEVVGLVADGVLRLDWSYCPHIHTRATIDALAQRFVAALRALIVHCTTPGVGAYTPSDFPLAALEEAQLDEVLSQVEFE